jgi:hypothetical protein
MRDLSGRRQRDINNEKRLQDYVAKQVTVYFIVPYLPWLKSRYLNILKNNAEKGEERYGTIYEDPDSLQELNPAVLYRRYL